MKHHPNFVLFPTNAPRTERTHVEMHQDRE